MDEKRKQHRAERRAEWSYKPTPIEPTPIITKKPRGRIITQPRPQRVKVVSEPKRTRRKESRAKWVQWSFVCDNDRMLAVDLGVTVPFALSTGELIYADAKNIAQAQDDLIKRLSNNYDVVVIEHLGINKMQRNADPGLRVKIRRLKWGRFQHQLRKAMASRGGQVLMVDPAFTSQACSSCHAIDCESRKGRLFACTACGFMLHADVNGARNILRVGRQVLSGGPDSLAQAPRIVRLARKNRDGKDKCEELW